MRSTRLLTLAAAASLAAALTPVTASAAHAATINPGVSMWSRPAVSGPTFDAICPSGWDLRKPGATYQVTAAGVHIRVTPGGAPGAAVGQDTLFASNWVVGGVGGYQCFVTAAGQTWVVGVSQSGASGWLSGGYLKPITPTTTYPVT